MFAAHFFPQLHFSRGDGSLEFFSSMEAWWVSGVGRAKGRSEGGFHDCSRERVLDVFVAPVFRAPQCSQAFRSAMARLIGFSHEGFSNWWRSLLLILVHIAKVFLLHSRQHWVFHFEFSIGLAQLCFMVSFGLSPSFSFSKLGQATSALDLGVSVLFSALRVQKCLCSSASAPNFWHPSKNNMTFTRFLEHISVFSDFVLMGLRRQNQKNPHRSRWRQSWHPGMISIIWLSEDLATEVTSTIWLLDLVG